MAVPKKTTETTELIKQDTLPVVMTPMDMIAKATSDGAGVEVISKLMDLQERWQANQAKINFENAVADAKAKIKPITKNRTVNYKPKSGGQVTYDHEDMAQIATVIDPILAEFGLNYRHKARQEGPILFVTCVLAHRDGHSEDTTLSGPNDASGSKNPLQAVGSSATYLQRYTLKLALGLAAAKDDDAQAISETAQATITHEQVKELEALAEELDVDKDKFLAMARGLWRDESLKDYADIPIGRYGDAVALMERKRGRK